jgi:hypothetical protein
MDELIFPQSVKEYDSLFGDVFYTLDSEPEEEHAGLAVSDL